MKYIIFYTNNQMESVEIKKENTASEVFREMRRIIGGYIEIIKLKINNTYYYMLVDEEGLDKKYNCNENATRFAKRIILGNVILIKVDYFNEVDKRYSKNI